jgi:hypothetical protein
MSNLSRHVAGLTLSSAAPADPQALLWQVYPAPPQGPPNRRASSSGCSVTSLAAPSAAPSPWMLNNLSRQVAHLKRSPASPADPRHPSSAQAHPEASPALPGQRPSSSGCSVTSLAEPSAAPSPWMPNLSRQVADLNRAPALPADPRRHLPCRGTPMPPPNLPGQRRTPSGCSVTSLAEPTAAPSPG